MAKKKFKVWIEQVNQTIIEVQAKDEHDATKKAYRAWRRTYGHSRVTYVEEVRDASK